MSNFILKTFLLFNTIRNLKLEQLVYQLVRRLMTSRQSKLSLDGHKVTFIHYNGPKKENSYDGNEFSFLNQKKKINSWNDKGLSKLWLYHLHYFDYILSDLPKQTSLNLINDWIEKNPPFTINAWEPYSTSLRIVNWIKFLSLHKIEEEKIVESLKSQICFLDANLEKHIQANHYFTNLKAMFFAAIFFNNEDLAQKYIKLFINEVRNQFLLEGVHYELTPAYHALLLNDIMEVVLVLNSLDLYKNEVDELKEFISKGYQYYKLHLMPNNQLARFGDTCIFNSPKNHVIKTNYNQVFPSKAQTVKISPESFYRLEKGSIVSIFKTKSFSPSYQPGHSHCDIGSYELFLNNKPFIVDTGISTYQEGQRRLIERSSISHNVLIRNNKNQANIWKAFRVAQRAKKQNIRHEDNSFEIQYTFQNVCFTRIIKENENGFIISDKISKKGNLESIIHLHPNISIDQKGDTLCLKLNHEELYLSSNSEIEILKYEYAEDFNTLRKANYVRLIQNNSNEVSYKLYEK